MKRPYEPQIETNEAGELVVNDPEPSGFRGINPSTGEALPDGPSVETRISQMLLSTLRGVSVPQAKPGSRVPAHMQKYL